MQGLLVVGLLLGIFACVAGSYIEARKLTKAIERLAAQNASSASNN
jgi:hypothetical protein